MTNDEAQALIDALDSIDTLSWHRQRDESDDAGLDDSELFSHAERERSRIW